jgi:cytochrome c-type biogenesis protein CcmF
MIAELGLAALWLAAALAGLQLLAGFLGLRHGGTELAALGRPAAVVQALLCALAFGALLLVFARTDLSVALVAKNSHSAKPLIFGGVVLARMRALLAETQADARLRRRALEA